MEYTMHTGLPANAAASTVPEEKPAEVRLRELIERLKIQLDMREELRYRKFEDHEKNREYFRLKAVVEADINPEKVAAIAQSRRAVILDGILGDVEAHGLRDKLFSIRHELGSAVRDALSFLSATRFAEKSRDLTILKTLTINAVEVIDRIQSFGDYDLFGTSSKEASSVVPLLLAEVTEKLASAAGPPPVWSARPSKPFSLLAEVSEGRFPVLFYYLPNQISRKSAKTGQVFMLASGLEAVVKNLLAELNMLKNANVDFPAATAAIALQGNNLAALKPAFSVFRDASSRFIVRYEAFQAALVDLERICLQVRSALLAALSDYEPMGCVGKKSLEHMHGTATLIRIHEMLERGTEIARLARIDAPWEWQDKYQLLTTYVDRMVASWTRKYDIKK
jgi:hypothetical protein